MSPRVDTPPTPAKKVTIPYWAVVVAILVAAGLWMGIGWASKKDKAPASPGAGTELCALMRDPSNDILEASDLRRMAGWDQTQLLRYVRDRCPDLLWRVGG